jgi:serine protease Do
LKVERLGIIELEADMNLNPKHMIAVLAMFLIGGTALPVCLAQTQVFPDVLRLNPGGAYLGIQMGDVNADNMSKYKLNGERGVIVRSVDKGSPAETANIKPDDVILEYGGNQVWSTMQFSRLVQETPPGRKVDVVVSRDGKRMNLTAQIGNLDRRADNAIAVPPLQMFGPGGRHFEFRLPDIPNGSIVIPNDRKPRLGVTLQPLTDQLGQFFGSPDKKGALVSSVVAGSASDGKLKPGDVIIKADDRNIDDPDDLVRFVAEKAEGDITMKVIRDKKEITVTVSLPAAESRGGGYKL